MAADLQRWSTIRDLIQRLCDLPLPLTLLPDEDIATLFHRTSRRFGSSIGIEFQRAPLSVSERIAKRALDLIVAVIGIVLLTPMFLIIALAIKLDSPGPVLYRQRRVGRGGVIFFCYKFRTMRQDAEADTGPTWAGDDDPRITRVGNLLRRSRLDEIPQLWCVLKGDMGFVGPRPERPEFVEWLTKVIPYYPLRHSVLPGITGWAQIQYKYGNTQDDAKEKLQYDLYYIKNTSIGLDVLIIFQTIKIVLLGRGAQ